MHTTDDKRRVPGHVFFLSAFAAVTALAAFALMGRQDDPPKSAVVQPRAATPALDAGTWSRTQNTVLGIREPAVIDRRAAGAADYAPARPLQPVTVAAMPRAPRVLAAAAPRHDEHTAHRALQDQTPWPSGSGGARSLASLPPPGD